MNREEAIEAIKCNWPDSRYTILREALDMAISALREQDVADKDAGNNEPLTMYELRKMDGEPAWFVSLHDGFASWGIVRVVEMSKVWFIAVAGAERAFGDLDGYGKTWLAFRQKPEEDDHA